MSSSLRRAVLLDSSATLALLDADDANHEYAVEVARDLGAERRPVFVTDAVEAETHALLLRRLGRALAREWLLQGGLEVLRVTTAEHAEARRLIATHEDKDWSLCDALSFAVIEQRGAAGAFAFDHHFVQRGRFRVWGHGARPAARQGRR